MKLIGENIHIISKKTREAISTTNEGGSINGRIGEFLSGPCRVPAGSYG
jgi:hypothetical protein